MLASTVQVGSFRHRIRSARDGHHRRVDQRDLPVARATALRHAAESRRGQRRRVAGRRGRDGHRHRVVVVSSDSAVSSTVADVAEPPALPVKVTVDPESATPVGLPDSDSVKSVPSAPPARTPADPPGSPPRTAHGPGSAPAAPCRSHPLGRRRVRRRQDHRRGVVVDHRERGRRRVAHGIAVPGQERHRLFARWNF